MRIDATLERAGFYPAGGGRARFVIHSNRSAAARCDCSNGASRSPFWLRRRSRILPLHIAERECETIRRLSGWPKKQFVASEIESNGPGNVVRIVLEYEKVTEVITGFGEKGVKAEAVAKAAYREASRYLESAAVVGEHLADQLLMADGSRRPSDRPHRARPIARHDGVSEFRTLKLTDHSTTHIEILKTFLDVDIEVENHGPDHRIVRVKPREVC